MSAQRIQRRRVKGWRMPEGAVYVGRGSKWGNPWRVGQIIKVETPSLNTIEWWLHREFDTTPELAVALYRAAFALDADEIRAELRGKDLACWCPLEDEHGNQVPCHADVLLEIANRGDGQ